MSRGASTCLRHIIIALLVLNETFTALVSCEAALESSKARVAKDDELCQKQMYLLVSSYQERTLWALKVFDSWGKSQSGLFSRNLVNFGHYEQCLQSKHTFDDPVDGTFQGQHCMVFFEDAPNVTVNSDVEDLLLPIMVHVELMRQYMNFYRVQMGTAICIPSTCSTEMVRAIADAMLSKNSLRTTRDYQQSSYCNTINILDMRNIDMFAALFFCFMALLLILSTAYDLTMRHNNRELPKWIHISSNLKKVPSQMNSIRYWRHFLFTRMEWSFSKQMKSHRETSLSACRGFVLYRLFGSSTANECKHMSDFPSSIEFNSEM